MTILERLRVLAVRLRPNSHKTPPAPIHPRRAALHETLTFGDRAADAVSAVVGSWRFVLGQNVFVMIWIAFNLIAVFGLQWDPRPFILLNLLFSWQASNTGPVLQLSSNRQAAKDRKRDDLEAQEVEMLVQLLEQNTDLTREVHALVAMREGGTPAAPTVEPSSDS